MNLAIDGKPFCTSGGVSPFSRFLFSFVPTINRSLVFSSLVFFWVLKVLVLWIFFGNKLVIFVGFPALYQIVLVVNYAVN